MNTPKLPSKLAKEPLIDVVFEIRFSSSIPGATVLPGLLFSKLKDVTSIEPLPASQLPPQMRAMDPGLHFSPLNRLMWGKFSILVGDRSLGIGCLMPYPGWTEFKAAIEEVAKVLHESGIVQAIERYSIKYVDFFNTADDFSMAFNQFDIGIRIGDFAVKAENAVLRVELPRDSFLHAIQMMTGATVQQANGPVSTGAILDVDTLSTLPIPGLDQFIASLPSLLDEIHMANKVMFFDCLSDIGLRNLEPQYGE